MPNQFAFGSELIVAPITTPRDPVTLRGAARAWLPPGTWIDIFTATVYEGDREVELHRDLGSIPALLRAGGILPLAAEDDLDATRNPERLELLVAPGADGEFTLVEDDGTGATPADIPTARTTIAWEQAAGVLTIAAADDPHGVLPREREWTVRFLGVDREPVARRGSHRRAAARRGRRGPRSRARRDRAGRAVRDAQRGAVGPRGQGGRVADAELSAGAGGDARRAPRAGAAARAHRRALRAAHRALSGGDEVPGVR